MFISVFVILFVSVPVFQSMFGVMNFYGKVLKRVKNVCDSSSIGAVFCFAWVMLTHWGFDIAKSRLNFGWRFYFNALITEEGSSNSEKYGCWDSEHDSFSENCVVDFTVGCINDNRKLCKNRNRQVSKYIILRFNNRENDIMCGSMFTAKNGQSNEFIKVANVKSKVKLSNAKILTV